MATVREPCAFLPHDPPPEAAGMSTFSLRLSRLLVLASLLLIAAWPARAQVTPEQQAAMLLTSARRAYNDKNYPFAAARFREFLQRFAAHREANAARYGLALCLVEG